MSHSRSRQQIMRVGVSLIIENLIKELESLKNENYRRHRLWVRPWIDRRNYLGASNQLLMELAEEDEEAFKNHLRVDKKLFEQLLSKVTPFIQKQDTTMRKAIPARIKLQIVLRYFASGDSFGTLEYMYRVPRCTISYFFEEVCEAVWSALQEFIQVPQTQDEWRKIIKNYYQFWNFHNCCGAMDGKLINIRCPPNTGSDYFDYKKNFSIILLAIADANYNFIYIDVGTNGRANDSSVYEKSSFKAALSMNLLNIPREGVFVADDAFPLTTKILKPYSRIRNFNEKEKIFNYRLSRARRVIENAFGLLVSRFRVYEKPIPLSVSKVEKIVKATCALHNWIRKSNPHCSNQCSIESEDWESGRIISGEWRNILTGALHNLPSAATNNSDVARRLRDIYAEKFITTDSVPWQWNMI